MIGKHEEKKTWLIIVLLVIGIVICAGVTIWALFFRQNSDTLIPDYAPRKTEQNAYPITGDDETKLNAPEGGGAISIEYESRVTIDLSDGMAYLNYANPGKSTQDIVLRIEIKDTVVAQSGTILPGHQVSELELLEDSAKKLREGVYDAKFRILSYDPKTGEKAMVDTLAEITVTVQP
ncbi:MAG: hypothetical protein MR328_03215 [Firmicutes bacterium]|nr:hypothetical protein [Bacillota bacterium]